MPRNRAAAKAYQAEYYRAHKDATSPRRAAYRIAHRLDKASYNKQYRMLNRETLAPYDKDYYAKNKERISARNSAHYAAHREEKLARDRLYRYGLTPEAARSMLESQGGTCALCHKSKATCVDHDHITGAVRGMLCRRCNMLLAALDDSAWLDLANVYLSVAGKRDGKA